jgi:transcriptional regulator with XRE-family HTH domain
MTGHAGGRKTKTFGSMLRARRRDLQLTPSSLAAKLGVKSNYITYLELDRRRPSLHLLSRLAKVLDLDFEQLILVSHPEARGIFKTSEIARRQDQGWRDFQRNKDLLNRYNVTKKELQVLSQIASLGRVTMPRSFFFILNSIRLAVEDEEF